MIPPLSLCRWSLLALLLLQPLWHVWLHPPVELPMTFAVLVSVVPMLIALGLGWRLTRDGLVLAGCILLLYFTYAVTEAYTVPSLRGVAFAQIALVTIFFMALLNLRRKRTRSP
jgi:uncharacterized membrane protein